MAMHSFDSSNNACVGVNFRVCCDSNPLKESMIQNP